MIGGSLESHRVHTRERIFEALSRLMYERGYDAISLADVAAECGMARTAMYNYFSDKESLLIGYASRETDRYVAELREALSEVEGPVARLQVYIRSQLTYFSEHHLPPGPALRHMLDNEAYSKVLDHVRALDDELRSILEEGNEQRYLIADDITDTGAMINACIARGSSLRPGDDRLGHTIELTEAFVLRALGIRLDRDGRARRLPRTAR
ncbi:MAG TPA: TetR/AcrR family transcriptional regulator [Iamia sp.]